MLSCRAGQGPSVSFEKLVSITHWKSLLFAAAFVSASAAAQELDLDDLESRIEYAWFTEDANSLRNLIQSTESVLLKGGDSTLARYELGFAHYRLGLMLLQKSDAGAGNAMANCVDELDRSLKTDEQFAEGYALQAACYAALAGIRPWKAMLHGPQSASRIEKALKLAPGNPRVALLDGVADHEKPKAFGGDPARAQTKFRRSVQLFENNGAMESGGPRWGGADAYLYVGRGLREAGDTLGARNALERALIIAPDFAAARRELRRLTSPAS
jgi:tetratricopeptide (TPR) repeat protein